MDYKKKYENALAHAKEIHRNEVEKRRDMEFIFPELAESEDERIRKGLIKAVSRTFEGNTLFGTDVTREEALAWLEKQGSEPNWYHHKVDLSNCSEEYRKAYYDGWNNCNMQYSQCKSEGNDVVKCLINGMKFYYEDNEDATWGTEKFSMKVKDIIKWLEKQSEKKSIIDGILTATNYDKMFKNCKVHKFNAGDWIIFNGITLYIEDVGPGYYKTISVNGISQSYEWNIDKFSRLWTIQDAKDGDVLATKNFVFIFKNVDDDNSVHYYCHYEIRKHEDNNQFGIALPQSLMGRVGNGFTHYLPATKGQRDILFQTMKEAGYEWNAEKKELKKIEQEWNEEDEENMKKILDAIGSYYYLTTDDDVLCDWLKKRLLPNDKNL